MGGVAQVPPPYRIEAEWRAWDASDPLRARIWLFGSGAHEAALVGRALAVAAIEGVGRRRVPMNLARARVIRGRLGGIWRARGRLGRNPRSVQLELRTPLRLLRQRQPMRAFSLPDLVRNLNLRLAVWGHYHQNLPWAPRWEFLEADARSAQVVTDHTRWEAARRYSGRQDRLVEAGGLLGTVALHGVSPRLLAVLRAAEVLGAGKGGTVGLGSVRVREL